MTPDAGSSVGVIGGGAWGTALALVAARAGRDVLLWARDADQVETINATARNPRYLPEIELNPPLRATADLGEVTGCAILVLATPAQTTRQVAARIAADLRPATPIVLAAKGFERGSSKLLSDVLREVAPAARPAALSGPSFAVDVASGLPTAVTIAADDASLARKQIGRASCRERV